MSLHSVGQSLSANQSILYLRFIKKITARIVIDDKVAYQRVKRVTWLASDNSWVDVVCSIWVGDHGELSRAHLNGNSSFTRNLTSWSVRFQLVFFDRARGPLPLRATVGLPDNCSRLVDSLQQTVDASTLPNLVGKFTQQRSSTIQLWHIDNCYLGIDIFPR